MARTIKAGSTDVSVVIKIIDATAGTPELGVVFNTSGIDLQYRREAAANVSITEATLAALTTAHADGGFLEIGNGYYRLDLPDAAVAAGATGVLVHGTVTGMVVIGEYIELVAYDPYDAVRLGLTALPNANADAAGGLPISDAGGLDLDAKLAATNEVTAARMGALTDWIDGGRLDLIIDSILDDTGTAGVVVASIAANAVNASALAADAVTEIQSGLATAAALTTVDNEIATLQTSVEGVPTNAELASAFTEIKGATWASGTDTLEAIRDRGDSAWITATGFSTLDAAGVRTAVGLASANLDTQLADLPTVAEFEARTVLAATYATASALVTVDTVVDAIKAKTDSLTFTVAGNVDSNVQYVNDVLVTGTGASGDTWGP